MKKKILLFIWIQVTKLIYRQGAGWPWLQKQVEEIASMENYKIEMKRQRSRKK